MLKIDMHSHIIPKNLPDWEKKFGYEGFIRLEHSVLEFSDRDIVSYYRNLNDLNGSKRLNKKLLEVISNYVPDILVLGHADLISIDTLAFIKKITPI